MSEVRPKLKLKFSKVELTLVLFVAAGFALNLFWINLEWASLPETIPTHFGITGEADAWGPKSFLLFLPIAGLVMSFFMLVLAQFPHVHNFPWNITARNAEPLYRLSRLVLLMMSFHVMTIFTWVTSAMMTGAKGGTVNLGFFFLGYTLLMPLVIVVPFVFKGRQIAAS